MNFGEEFSIPQGKQFELTGSWIPETPQKQIPTGSNLLSVNGQGNRLGRWNWQELDGFPTGYVQDILNNNGPAQNINPVEQIGLSGDHYFGSINNNAGPYTQFLQEIIGENNNTWANLQATNGNASIGSANVAPILNLHSQADNWRRCSSNIGGTSTAPILNLHSQPDNWRYSRSLNPMCYNQTHSTSSHFLRNSESFLQMPPYGYSVPYKPIYLNSPPRTEVDAASDFTTTFQSMLAAQDQTRKMMNKQVSTVPTSVACDSEIHEKEKQEKLVVPSGNEVPQQNCELLQSIVDSSSAVISTPLEERKDYEKGGDQGIDLNKTPQQKPPKRRKHRPKVIVEGKPKRAPKSATEKDMNSKDNPSGRRKYVKRKGLTELGAENTDSTKESDHNARTPAKRKYARNKSLVLCTKETDPSVVPARKSCRRILSFDTENIRNESQAEISSYQEMLEGSKSSKSQAAGSQNVEYSGFKTKLTAQTSQQSGLAQENHPQAESSRTPFLNKTMPIDYTSMPGVTAAKSLQLQANDMMENENVIERNINMENADSSQKSYRNGHAPTQKIIQSVPQGKTNWENVDGTKELMFERRPQSVPTVLSNSNEGKGSEGGQCHTTEYRQFCTASSMSSLSYQGIFQMEVGYRYGSNNGAAILQDFKRKRIQDESNAYINAMKYAMSHGSGQLQTKGTNSVNAKQSTSPMDCGTSDPHFQSNIVGRKSGEVSKLTEEMYVPSTAAALASSTQHISSQLHSGTEGNTKGMTVDYNLAAMENCNHLLPTTPEKAPILQFGMVSKRSHINVSEKKNREPGLSRRVPAGRGNMLQEQKEPYEYHQSKARGPSAKQNYFILIEELLNKFNGLTVDERNKKAKDEVQNALVVYKGAGAGVVVPYEGFEYIKKRKPRPKVELDSETNRIWNLLMGKEGEDIDDTDKEKEKWWEEQRRVFKGRVDSFIARMHLVQGDRRFSKWKGSVVDSVIGVFLTQNVSDHLSSSAFMSLAARFPSKSSSRRHCDGDGAEMLIEVPEVCDVNPTETIKWHENLFRYPLDSQSSTPNRSTDYRRNSENSGIEKTSFMERNSQSLEDEVLSSQGSFDSLVIQANGGITSNSGSNSETEEPITSCKFNNIHGSTIDQIEKSFLFEEFYNCVSQSSLFHEGLKNKQLEVRDGQKSTLERKENLELPSSFYQYSHVRDPKVQVQAFGVSNHQLHMTLEYEAQEGEGLESFGEECMSSWVSTASGFNKPKLGLRGGKIIVQHNDQARSQYMATTTLNTSSSEHIMHLQEISLPVSHTESSQLCNNRQGNRKKALQSESTSITMPLNSDAVTNMQKSTSFSAANALKLTERPDVQRMSALDKDKDVENREVQSSAKEPMHSSQKEHGENSIFKPKRRMAQEKKNNAPNWDELRKQVQANGCRKERSKGTMDSLDYEAMRNADVNEISNTIKERGMNNMLAERIKEFLNRLVREHGSIDLEWLRDVPPDKAKDYLLSIRGLGLKSVECVRLLTLHHLAFPVDTNVGRIAVRLGWVPLQPLPESLQLHLLELYPILESVQKYLWPRLCKLDQRTLYELHYQMITFGKVFCTKSKPNCNACPMRGECRHFASAFASARLALPGPEEKGIRSSTVTMISEGNPVRVVNEMALPPPEHNLLKVGPNNGNPEPIIEEPATPEPERTEESPSDIEDACYEDPDEIPTIKLNIEEFTENLQHFMQAKMELQEGDLSRALVALSPNAASIPTPKLKNVSRLRTEHYVYELPDTHPLLKQMERREPDDPSPYLFAIWTPGETANSIKPPEQSCGSQEPGRLCNEKTCFACHSVREANAQTVRGTILIPCRTAMRGSFPLNGTYFQVNEVFADHESSLNPIDVPREWMWNLPRRTVYFGTSVSTIFKGLSTEGIQYCFWKGFVCVRGFDQKTRAPRPLMARLHFPASKLTKIKT